MGNTNKPLTEEQVRAGYALYEKNASRTMKQTEKTLERLYFCIVYCLTLSIGLILSFIFQSAAICAVCFIAGIALGIAAGKLRIHKIKSNVSEVVKIERSEGYTERFFEEVNKPAAPFFQLEVTAAQVYVFCGNPDMALEKLKNVDAGVYVQRPNGAHLYYAALLSAYLLKGDLDHAADTYTKGAYYLNTYKNSPIYGTTVSLALGMYEFYCGHYGASLQLLDNAIRIHYADLKPENRIPDENMTSMLCYWKAINLASIGDKAATWEMINFCKSLYTTDYYKQCAEKLLADMAEDEKRKNANT